MEITLPDPSEADRGGIASITAEQFDMRTAVGGPRGVAEAVIPTVLFLVLYTVTQELNWALIIALAASVLFIVVRALQRIPIAPALGGLFTIALSALLAWRSGQATDFFIWGLITNLVYLLGLLLSLAVRWPALGLLIGFLKSHGTAWRQDSFLRRRYARLTWLWAALFFVRLAVQTPLYLLDATSALGIVRLAMGVPLFGLTAWFSWLMVRDLPEISTPQPPKD
ncbi:MAG: DUF3159 domain-containing protein [Trueperella sp.]|nr:DUF3159 domain-containing protein [Trueperella sp.]